MHRLSGLIIHPGVHLAKARKVSKYRKKENSYQWVEKQVP